MGGELEAALLQFEDDALGADVARCGELDGVGGDGLDLRSNFGCFLNGRFLVGSELSQMITLAHELYGLEYRPGAPGQHDQC